MVFRPVFGVVVLAGVLILSSFAPIRAQEDNQTRDFARLRAQQVEDVGYDLWLGLERDSETFKGRVTITCVIQQPDRDLIVDFNGKSVDRVGFNGLELDDFQFLPKRGRIVVPASVLQAGPAVINIDFVGNFSNRGQGFHRFVDPEDGRVYCYTDFEPNDAHLLFPCFDQPDLKATYALEMTAPVEWQLIGNGPLIRKWLENGSQRAAFQKTKRFSTYLFHISAGPFALWHDTSTAIPLGIYCRQSLAKYMDEERIFATTRQGFDFFQRYFDTPYAFEKYDQIFVPEFNAGAMENVGAVTFNERSLYRSKPSNFRLMRRDMVILHEMAHMWFGDLVTMTWWNDLWLNESFASYGSFLALEALGREGVWASFEGFRSRVFNVDQGPSSHPILAEVPDIRAASSIFDAITYGKGLAVLRQLDYELGGDRFRDGLRTYFKRHAFGNTTLDDFVQALESVLGEPLEDWVQQWLATQDVNRFELDYALEDGRISQAFALQSPGRSNQILRPHASDLGLYYLNAEGHPILKETLKISYKGARDPLPQLVGKQAPVFILPNLSGYDYVLDSLDPHSLAWVSQNMQRINDPEAKTIIWRVMWEMVRENKLNPRQYLETALHAMPRADSTLLAQLSRGVQKVVEDYLAAGPHRRALVARAFSMAQKVLTSPEAVAELQPIWWDILMACSETRPQLDALVALYLGNPKAEAFELTFRRKWEILTLLVSLGHPEADRLVKALSEEDQTAQGRNALLRLSALRPTAEAKSEAWEKLTAGKQYSLYELREIARGFLSQHQKELGKPYIDKYFEVLPTLYKERDWEFVSNFAGNLFPYHGYDQTVSAARRFLARTDLDKTLKNLVLKELYQLERDMEVRARDKAAGKS